ncbi:MAG: hypothetical protein ABIN83_03530 [Sphingomicrobium sp.]
MSKVHDRGQIDWLVELVGAIVPAVAAAFVATKVAPSSGLASLGAAGVTFLTAYAVMRAVPAEPRLLGLPAFDPLAIDDELLLDDPLLPAAAELLLDQPLIEAATDAVAELLLDDPLLAAASDSRVVQLFADGGMPTAGQMRDRIDRHLANGGRPMEQADASDALSEALAELRRSLRQA